MTWPWQRHKRDQLDANRRVDQAEKRALAAHRRRVLAEKQAQQARQRTAKLRNQIDQDEWTRLLHNAWAGR